LLAPTVRMDSRETRATPDPKVLLVLPAYVAPKETRVTPVLKAPAALRARRDPAAKQASTARTDCRARGVCQVSTAKTAPVVLAEFLATPAGTD